MSVNMKEFQTHPVRNRDYVKESNERNHHGRIVPGVFNSGHFSNNPRYLEGDGNLHIVQNSNG